MKNLPLNRKVFNLTLSITLWTLSLAGAAFSQATTKTTNLFVPLSPLELAFVPCANGGAGELVVFSGTLHIQTHVTVNDNLVNMRSHFQPQGAVARGVITRDIYRDTGVTRSHDIASLTNGTASFTFINNFRLIGPGRDNNLQVHQNIHMTVNANGDVTSTVNNISIECN